MPRLGDVMWTSCSRLIVVLSASSLHAQTQYDMHWFQSPELQAPAGFGTSLLAADVNADGFNDLIVGEYFASVQGVQQAGRAWIFFGPTLAAYKKIALALPPHSSTSPRSVERPGMSTGTVTWT